MSVIKGVLLVNFYLITAIIVHRHLTGRLYYNYNMCQNIQYYETDENIYM
jgi:hypothetical protein